MSYSVLMKKYETELNECVNELYSVRGDEISKFEKDPKKIYSYFKTLTAKEEFYYARQDFQCDSIFENGEPGEDDVNIIDEKLSELGKVTDNIKLKHPPTVKKLLAEAESLFVNGTIYKDDEAELKVYLLFKSNFFEKYPLPIIALNSSECSGKREDIFLRVYGQYILLYDYLVKKLPTTKSTNLSQVKSHTKSKSATDLELKSFKDLFKEIHKDKFDEMIKLLSNELPLRVTSKYDELLHPFVIVSTDGVSWNNAVDNPISYLTGIYFASKKWLKAQVSQEKTMEGLKKTFKVEIKSRTAFSKNGDDKFHKKYIEPFKILFEPIK